jgi:hypothetical protein
MSVPQYWLADSEARVLGPVAIDVVRDLSMRGKLRDVRAVSRDGRHFVPLREVPEIQAALAPPRGDEIDRAQYEATRQIREWLESIKGRATSEVLRVPSNASKESARAAFFSLVHRYLPSRLPAEATPELRLACEDAFLVLAERIIEFEKQGRSGPAAAPRPQPLPNPAAQVTWRGGMIHVKLSLPRGDARPFTMDAEASWKTDSLFVVSSERVMVGTPGEVTLTFEGHVTQIHATGRVTGVTADVGFGLKMLDLVEQQRSIIRTWVSRAEGR